MGLDPRADTPLYDQLARSLRDDIRAGRLPPGSQLPSEQDLSERYGISRTTVRTALGKLRAEGLVRTETGRGTFVVHQLPVQVPLALYSSHAVEAAGTGPFTAAAHAAGVNGRMELVEVRRVPATDDQAARMHLYEQAPLVLRERHAMIDDVPVEIQRAYYPLDLVEETGLENVGFQSAGAFAVLRRIGHQPRSITVEVTSRAPTEEDRRVMRLGPDAAVTVHTRTTRDATGRVVELRTAVASERLTLVFEDLPLQ